MSTSAAVAIAAPRVAPRSVARVPVRTATWDDAPEIMRLLHDMHAEGGMLPLDEDAASATFARAFDRQGGTIGVIGSAGDIRGMIYLMITRFWYTGAFHLEEIFNYVRPDCRREGLAGTLIEFAKDRAEKFGIPLAIGVLSNSRMVAKVRLYERYLGPPAGAFFVYNADWANDPEAGKSDDGMWGALLAEGRRRQRDVGPQDRVISAKVLARLGDGDVARGRAVIDTFINGKIGNRRPNGTGR